MTPAELHLLHRAYQAADIVFRAQTKQKGLSVRQLAVLIALSEKDAVNHTVLVKRTGIDRSTLAEMVPRLQRKRLLKRRRAKHDARAYAITLTDEGHRMLRTGEPIARFVDQRVLDALPAEQREPFVGRLQSIIRAVNDGLGTGSRATQI
jgi:MarR family transcriptional regulator, temperature-dependent positive regulator of motility